MTQSGKSMAFETERSTADMAGRVAKGAAWIVSARFFMRAIGLLNTLIVARLLTPEDFGLIAIAFTVLQILQGMSDFGAAQAVVKFQDADRDDYNTLWTLSVLRGSVIALFIVLLAGPAAHIYGDPRLFSLFLIIALIPLIEGLLNPKFFEFERAMDFSREFIVLGLNKVIAVVVSISLALMFRNYWALIGGGIAGAIVQLALSYYFRPFKPKFSLKRLKKLFAFTGWLTAAGALITFNLKLDALIIARFFGTAPTGGFYLGMQLAQLPTNELATPLSRALFPGMSEQQDDKNAMRQTCLGGVEAMAAIIAPMAVGFGFVARDLVPLFFGPGYEMAIPVLQYVAPALGIYFLSEPIRPYVIAHGQTKMIFVRELLYMLMRIPSFIIAAVFFGFIGAIIARALAGLVQLGLNLLLYAKVSGRPFWEPLQRAGRSLFALSIMSLWFLLIEPHLVQLPDQWRLVRIFMDASFGAFIYISAHYLAWRWAQKPDGVEQQLLSRVPFLRRFAQR